MPDRAARTDQALAAARGKLEEAGADEIPDEVADLAALEAAHREADSARVEAVRVATLAQERLRRLGELRTSFTRVTEGSGPLRERADMVRSLAATLEGKAELAKCGTLPAAVAAAYADASASGQDAVVLLSPACASFDQFADFEARGEAFREAVEGLSRPAAKGARA